MNINRLIREGRQRLGWTEQQFADEAGVTRGAVQQWEKPGGTAPNRSRQARVAELLGVRVAELMAEGPNPHRSPNHPARVPILPHHEAANFSELDNFSDRDGHEMVATSVEVRRHTYALRVVGDTMLSPTGDTFPEGSIIVVEPELAPRSGDYVVALKADNEPIFKMLVRTGSELYLKPLNPRYPVKPLGKGVVIGVVREFSKRFR